MKKNRLYLTFGRYYGYTVLLVLVFSAPAFFMNAAFAASPRAAGKESVRYYTGAVRIMPIGNSITQAAAGRNSYRRPLWQKLKTAGYNVDFVGSQRYHHGGVPLNQDFDMDHEGHWGWRADQLMGQMSTWAYAYRPDIVLMHVGSNDMFQGQSVSSTLGEINHMIDILRGANPNVKVLLAKLIPTTFSSNSQINSLNNAIPGFVLQKSTTQSPVILVDQNSGFYAGSDTYDGVHPNETGERKMADRWYSALSRLLTATPVSNQAPRISVTAPINNASFTAPATVQLQVNATDTDGRVTKVEYFNGGSKIGETSSSPFSFSWLNVSAGGYSITARATDDKGATATSAGIYISVGGVAVPPSSSGNFSGYYRIVAKHSGKVVDVSGVSTADGARIFQWTKNSGANQQWAIQSTGDGYYKIVARHSGKVLSTTSGTSETQQFTYTGADTQKWRVESTGDGYYRLTSKASGKVLDVEGRSAADGARLLQWSFNGGDNQKWRLESVGSTGRVASFEDGASLYTDALTLVPNPAVHATRLHYYVDQAQEVKITVANGKGQAMVQISKRAVEGNNEAAVNVAGFAKGIYLIQLEKDNKIFTKKLVVTQ